ncbi:MAG TPA: hypothetical protein VE377_11940 [Candidatus Dormibacteraeota bacterium]|nr:hypothetical protein [Candidatus Dormibacteraeota bacterium]
MSGRKWLGWRFKDRTPWWFKVIVGLIMADSALHFGMLLLVPMWAHSSRDAVHSHGVPFGNGINYFTAPWLGRYLETWWIGVALLAMLALLLVLNRDRLEREL